MMNIITIILLCILTPYPLIPFIYRKEKPGGGGTATIYIVSAQYLYFDI